MTNLVTGVRFAASLDWSGAGCSFDILKSVSVALTMASGIALALVAVAITPLVACAPTILVAIAVAFGAGCRDGCEQSRQGQ